MESQEFEDQDESKPPPFEHAQQDSGQNNCFAPG